MAEDKDCSQGDHVEVITKDKTLKGIVMPRPELLDDKTIVLKLGSGYNIGIDKKKIKSINILEKYYDRSNKAIDKKAEHIPRQKGLPVISILHTGGTIASKVDYRTGGVVSSFSPEDIEQMFPELAKIATIRSRLIFQMFSEDMEPGNWSTLAKEAEKEIKDGAQGIIITHGTDTLHYTSAALSFMLQNLPVPVILVGAQRSSDRGSSDAALNLISAAQFIINSDFSGVALCMHSGSDDNYCLIHQGNKVRKLHTSRRDAFRSINVLPLAKVFPEGTIEYLRQDYLKKNKENQLKVLDGFNDNIAIIKARPGLKEKEVMSYKSFDGIIIEGTGLGHTSSKLISAIKKLSKKSVVVMASQCIYGRIDMNVYSTGRELLDAGVISAEDMLPEVAYAKLGWAIANSKDLKEAKELFQKDIAGEISERTIEKAFLY